MIIGWFIVYNLLLSTKWTTVYFYLFQTLELFFETISAQCINTKHSLAFNSIEVFSKMFDIIFHINDLNTVILHSNL